MIISDALAEFSVPGNNAACKSLPKPAIWTLLKYLFEMHLWSRVGLFNPDLHSVLHSYSSLCLHQPNLRSNQPIIGSVEFSSYRVLKFRHVDVFGRADLIPEPCLYLFSFSSGFFVCVFGHFSYLAQNGNSPFALWWSTHSWQLLWRGHSFFGQGQLGADIT